MPLSLFFHLSPKDTTVSGAETWLWFGFSKAMGHAGLFFPQWAPEWSLCPHMRSVGPALPTLLIAGDVLDSVQLTSEGTEIHHCPKGNLWRLDRGSSTCVKQSDFAQPLNFVKKMLWTQASGEEISTVRQKKKKSCRCSTDKHPRFSCCFLNGHPCTAHLHYFTFSSCSLIRNLNMQSC